MSLFIYYVFDENTSRDAPESGAGEKLVEEKNIRGFIDFVLLSNARN
jgi:hypothetical protein